MFVALTSYDVTLLIAALASHAHRVANDTPKFNEVRDLRNRLIDEQAKIETKSTEAARIERAYHVAGQRALVALEPGDGTLPMVIELKPGDLKDCEGFPVPPLMDSIEKGAPPTHPNMGPEYYLLKFIDAMREKNPNAGALSSTSTADILEVLGHSIAASRCSGKPQALCQIFSIEIGRIVDHLNEG